MKRMVLCLALLLSLMTAIGTPAEAGRNRTSGAAGDVPVCVSAMEVIEKNLEAIGGEGRIRNMDTLILEGGTGSALLPPSQQVVLTLKKPDRWKQQSEFKIILCDGGKYIINNGNEEVELTGGDAEGMNYRIGFYHNAFSLLKWENHFDSAELLGIKAYGPVRQYEIRFPGAENGRDLLVYVDVSTFLIDRLVFVISQEGAGTLNVVNQLRDFEEFEGILIPTRVVFDKVGWETSPTHFVISGVKINPEVDEAIFESADIDFGTVVVEDGVVRGEVRGEMDGSLLTNIREDDLVAAGFEVTEWMDLSVGETSIPVKYLSNIQRSASEIHPDEVYLCRYPISMFPRMMLMEPDLDLSEKIPCARGDLMIVTRQADEGAGDSGPGASDSAGQAEGTD